MYKHLTFLSIVFLLFSCQSTQTGGSDTMVKTKEELKSAIENAKAGDEIVLANGTWKDVEIEFNAKGEEGNPIILRAETAGQVFIEGQSNLKFGGDYLVVDGLYFRNGYTPSRNVIQFITDNNQVANHCRVTNCVIENYNQLQRDRKDHWVEFSGKHNQLDHCYLAGKSNEGPTVRVDIKGNESIRNYHKIINNHFGPRPRKGGPKAETLQLGDSYTSMSPSHTLVASNLFEECNGEVEVISSKTNFNEFRNNVFYKSEGSLVTRHGNYCIIDGNYFIGDGTDNIGGVRLINTGHWVTNNYFYNLKGKQFRSPLAVMNGIPKSPLNRYNQVTDVVVAHNTWVNCTNPWHFGVGSNISQKDVLPLSEIRSARPMRTTVANNLIYNEEADEAPIVAHDEVPIVVHDKLDGITFKNNLIANQETEFEKQEGLEAAAVEMEKVTEYIYAPKSGLEDKEVFVGFDFEMIEKDIFGNNRADKNIIGAMTKNPATVPNLLDYSKYGPSWFSNEKEETPPTTLTTSADAGDLAAKIAEAKAGDIVALSPGDYAISEPLVINKKITLQSADESANARILYTGVENTPLFEMHPKGNLVLSGLILEGTNTQYAFASLKENMSSLYQLKIAGCEISKFNYVLKAYKQSFADAISFEETSFKDCMNGIELSEETNDKGDYNVEFLMVGNCMFDNIKKNVIDYYRGGYDESTIGGNLLVRGSTFINCGALEENGILLNTRGIINVNISESTFKNNRVKLVALLWGAKNNAHWDNEVVNSGKIVVEENLKLKLMY